MARARRKSRTGVAVMVSALVHAALLASLARVVPLPSPLTDHDIAIEFAPTAIEPPSALPKLPAQAPAVRRPMPSSASPPRAEREIKPQLAQPKTMVTPRPSPPRRTGSTPQASPPAAAQASAAQQGARLQAAGGGGAPGSTGKDGVRSALRTTVGCSHADYLALTPAERDACARGFGRQAALGARQVVDPIASAAKRRYFDEVQEAAQRLRDYSTPMDDDPDHGAGGPGHGPSVGCIHGKCGVISPQGTLTEESGIAPP